MKNMLKKKMKHTNQIKDKKQKNENKNRKIENKNESKQKIFDEKWTKPKKKPNDFEKTKMFGASLERLILVSANNHIYSFKGVSRVQKS